MKKNFWLMRLMCVAVLSLSVNFTFAQVLWNLKGGGMNHKVVEYPGGDKHNTWDWTAGLELEIPLSQQLNIETGLMYKNKFVCSDECNGHSSMLDLPVRAMYKHGFNKDLSLHVGVGPYASFLIDGGNIGNIQVGLQPAATLYWKNLNLGLSYNIPCIYRAYKDENSNAVMLTLGIRFKSHLWGTIGAVAAAVGTAAASVAGATSASSGGDYSSGGGNVVPSGGDGGSSGRGGKIWSECPGCKGSKKCRWCGGSGKYAYSKSGRCTYCYGKGVCPTCKGRGGSYI